MIAFDLQRPANFDAAIANGLEETGMQWPGASMPLRSKIRFLLGFQGAAALGVNLVFCPSAHAQSNVHHGVVYYSPPAVDSTVIRLTTERYEMGLIGLKQYPQDAHDILERRPGFEWFTYNSVFDNYVSGPEVEEDDLITTVAAAHGWDHEEAYMHFYDDTYVTLQGNTVFVPGWEGGSATDPSQARVPVYYSNLSRRLVNFSTYRAQQLNKEVFVALDLDAPAPGYDFYADGLFLDNSSYRLSSYGTIVSGGHVHETPDHSLIGSAAFQTWYWANNLRPFLVALKDTLQTSAAWSGDGKRKYSMINVSAYWTDDYYNYDTADIINTEFQYDPIRTAGPSEIQNVYNDDAAAAAVGIRTFNMPLMTKNYGGYSISYGDALLGSLAWHLATRTEDSILMLYGNHTSPSEAGWDTLTWRGCVDVVDDQLGEAVGSPYQFANGTDPLGRTYRVWGRDYDNGLVLVRPRYRSDDGIEPETAVTVPLSSPLAPVSPGGKIGLASPSVTLRNGGAAILLGDVGGRKERPPRSR